MPAEFPEFFEIPGVFVHFSFLTRSSLFITRTFEKSVYNTEHPLNVYNAEH